MSFINAIIDAQERNLCLERLKAELAETPYFQKTDKALTACIASQLLKKYERAVKANGSPLLLNEAMYAVMTMLTFQNSWKKSVELLSMSDCDYLTAIIDKASESFDASLENFKDTAMHETETEEQTHHIYTYHVYEYEDEPLFFLELKSPDKAPAAILCDILHLLDEAYSNTDMETTDWALEYQLWARMLLAFPTPSIMLNPKHLDIQASDSDGYSVASRIADYLAIIAPESRDAYTALLDNTDELNRIFVPADKPEDFDYTFEESYDMWTTDVVNYLRAQGEHYFTCRGTTKTAVLNDSDRISLIASEHRKCVERFGNEREWSVKDACDNAPGIVDVYTV